MIIYNKSDKMRVLKAVNLPTIRCFPGFTETGDGDIKKYETKVTKAWFDKDLAIIKSPNTTQKQEAKINKGKNDSLNKTMPTKNYPDMKA